VFTHKPVRDGSVISISIYGEYGSKFARRIAENAVKDGERLGANFDIVTVGDRQNFLFAVEPATPMVAAAPRAVRPKRIRRTWRLFSPAPQALPVGPTFDLGRRQPS
jgi:hypothetical protein